METKDRLIKIRNDLKDIVNEYKELWNHIGNNKKICINHVFEALGDLDLAIQKSQ